MGLGSSPPRLRCAGEGTQACVSSWCCQAAPDWAGCAQGACARRPWASLRRAGARVAAAAGAREAAA
eukprot:9562676-Alexandrium_andersonii.AAC.1